MSVSLLAEYEISNLMETLGKNQEIQEFVKGLDFFKKRNEGYVSDTPESFIQRSIWYGYIANTTAFNVQYEQNEKINYDLEDGVVSDLQTQLEKLRSLLYNCYTNDGNCFLMNEWMEVMKSIQDAFYIEQ